MFVCVPKRYAKLSEESTVTVGGKFTSSAAPWAEKREKPS
jgi:hypothetical protein